MYIVTVIRNDGLKRYGYSDKERAIKKRMNLRAGASRCLLIPLTVLCVLQTD